MTRTLTTLILEPTHAAIVHAILQTYIPHREVWAFGSRVNGTARPFSDLDLAVIGTEPLPRDTAAALREAFSESDLPFMVDVVDWATTSPEFRQVIERRFVVIQRRAVNAI